MTCSLGSILTAMVTPFREDLSLDLDGLASLTGHLLAHGSDGVVVAGTTGESPTLTDDEKIEMCRVVVDVARGRGSVIAGTGSNDAPKMRAWMASFWWRPTTTNRPGGVWNSISAPWRPPPACR